ncbi:MAG TPA: hypothetical protein VHS53_10575, partial [Mucilaginibacter sp.]|nr:hypothetical protein [Mucilaginibacter sp.]
MGAFDKIDYWVERMKVKFRRYPLLIFAIIIVYIGCARLLDDIWTRHMQFKGIVEGVAYDPKGNPTVRIAGEDYYLTSYNYVWPVKIETGDRLIKNRGEIRLLLI